MSSPDRSARRTCTLALFGLVTAAALAEASAAGPATSARTIPSPDTIVRLAQAEAPRRSTSPSTVGAADAVAPPRALPGPASPLGSPLPGGETRPEGAAAGTATAEIAEPVLPKAVEGTGADGRDAALPHDLSPWGMFMSADIVVKAVMVGLALASVLTWTLWLGKSLEIAGAKLRARRALGIATRARSLDEAAREAGRRGGPGADIVGTAAAEASLSARAVPHAGGDGLKERVVSHLGRIEAAAARRITRGTGLLATIGSTAPFVGLFGTVWGIMNAFIGISEAQTTNLAVVAPGIAEALLATATGLVAAIPAVVIYNLFVRSIAGYRALLADVSAATLRLLSRDLDFGLVPPGAPQEDRAGETAASVRALPAPKSRLQAAE